MGLEAAEHFRQYIVKRRTAMFTKTCLALKKKKNPKTKLYYYLNLAPSIVARRRKLCV
jgi:hypothetical protein